MKKKLPLRREFFYEYNLQVGATNNMLEKPEIPDGLIVSRLQEEYGLRVAALTFLPIGADMGTAVYRVFTQEGATYFLKLRKRFTEIVVTVPLFLQSPGDSRNHYSV